MKRMFDLSRKPVFRKKGGMLPMAIMLLLISPSGCHHEQPVPEETEESEAVPAAQWISTGHWEEYTEILCGYAEKLHIEVVFAEENGEYDAEQGIICDLNGDGLTPELLWLQREAQGYSVKTAYIANDGRLSVNERSSLEMSERDAESILLNRQSASGVWDILIEEKMDDDRYTSFYRYEKEECIYCGTAAGIAERGNAGTEEDTAYGLYGVYTIKDIELWEGYVKKQKYEIDEAAKKLKQIIPAYMEEPERIEGYYELSGTEYIELEEGTSVLQMNFSKNVKFVSRQVLPIGLLRYEGQDYVLVESTQGEMGYILWKGTF